MSDPHTPTYEQLFALCAQMAAALEKAKNILSLPKRDAGDSIAQISAARLTLSVAITAYRTLSPDPVWQRVPEGCVVVPAEPTKEMLRLGEKAANEKLAAWRGYDPEGAGVDGMEFCVREAYRAMTAPIINRARGEG
ncbi:hypothetical protein [Ferrovibrio sp.]|uniref:hypothetical protein n=1 Tax=Ferrovibrio sp. TaxID=1917215 RepID=UPI0031200389